MEKRDFVFFGKRQPKKFLVIVFLINLPNYSKGKCGGCFGLAVAILLFEKMFISIFWIG
jgi:hypothetical protein